jgi:hypothetical protein
MGTEHRVRRQCGANSSEPSPGGGAGGGGDGGAGAGGGAGGGEGAGACGAGGGVRGRSDRGCGRRRGCRRFPRSTRWPCSARQRRAPRACSCRRLPLWLEGLRAPLPALAGRERRRSGRGSSPSRLPAAPWLGRCFVPTGSPTSAARGGGWGGRSRAGTAVSASSAAAIAMAILAAAPQRTRTPGMGVEARGAEDSPPL